MINDSVPINLDFMTDLCTDMPKYFPVSALYTPRIPRTVNWYSTTKTGLDFLGTPERSWAQYRK